MITVYIRSRESEGQFARLIAGESKGRVYVNYPIKGHTRKVRGEAKYRIINGTI